MKHSIYTEREVPMMHPGCSMAETGANDYDDFDNPLPEFKVIPEGKEIPFVKKEEETVYDGSDSYKHIEYSLPPEIKTPADVREEPRVTVVIPKGVHPFTYLKDSGVDFTKAWIFLRKDVVETLRKLPVHFHHDTVAYGEFFRFVDLNEISLQKIEYFPDWKMIFEGKLGGEEFYRTETPECIIEVVM